MNERAKVDRKRLAVLMKERIAVVPNEPEWPRRYDELEVRLKKL